MALCYLRLLITCLLSLALATAVELGDEPQLAAHLHEQCVNDHGEIYKVVPANSGFIFTPIEGVHVGVKLVRSSVGGGCKADMYQACSVLNDDNCRPVVNCTDPSNQQTCMNCQPGRFQKVFKAQVTMYADCENGEVSMRSAPEVQQMEVLRAVKDAIVNDCELKGCRYATESLGNVRLRRRNKGTRFQFPARTKRSQRKLEACDTLKQGIETISGCRVSSAPLPKPPPKPIVCESEEYLTPADIGCILAGVMTFCSGILDVPACLRFPQNTPHVVMSFGANTTMVELPLGIFDGVTDSLVRLSMTNMHMVTRVSKEFFKGLSKLTSLTFEAPALKTMDTDLFAGLTSLEELSIQGSGALTSLKTELFTPVASTLLSLNIGYMSVASLPSDLLGSMSKLTTLVVYRMNSLTSLPADLFRDTTALETLNMDFNIQLTELPAGLLNGLSALTSLRFEGLRIATLPAGLFDDTPLTVLFNPRGVNFDCCDVDTYTQLVDFQDNVNVRCVNPAPGPVPAERPLC
eukprot:m.11957 g.11957  ORF g.11957 m.11957 type:complete len:520 (+) comp9890_c0_seq1:300-1859(+)